MPPLKHHSTIKSIKPFTAEVFPIVEDIVKLEDGIKQFGEGITLEIINSTDNPLFNCNLHCIILDKEKRKYIERFIIPNEIKENPKYWDYKIMIKWKVFKESFIVEKYFDIDNIDYTRVYQVRAATIQYIQDNNYPLRIPGSAKRKIGRVIQDYINGFITHGEMYDQAVSIAIASVGIVDPLSELKF